jgi:hypothetical protein
MPSSKSNGSPSPAWLIVIRSSRSTRTVRGISLKWHRPSLGWLLTLQRGAYQPHLCRSDWQHEALGKQGHNEQRNTDHYRSIPRRLNLWNDHNFPSYSVWKDKSEPNVRIQVLESSTVTSLLRPFTWAFSARDSLVAESPNSGRSPALLSTAPRPSHFRLIGNACGCKSRIPLANAGHRVLSKSWPGRPEMGSIEDRKKLQRSPCRLIR